MTKSELNAFKKAWAAASQSKKLLASHHVMYNILRDVPTQQGFTPITNHNRLTNGADINHGIADAARRLSIMVKWAQKEDQNHYTMDYVKAYLEPFNGAITVEQLAELHVPPQAEMPSGFGIYKAVAQKIVADNLTHITFDDISTLVLEIAA